MRDDTAQPVAALPANRGHGHVYPRPDGVKARCGGPAMCRECKDDLARWTQELEQRAATRPPVPAPAAEPVATREVASACRDFLNAYELAHPAAIQAAYLRLRAVAAHPPVAQPQPAGIADLRCAAWLDPECAEAGACQSLRFKAQAQREPLTDEQIDSAAEPFLREIGGGIWHDGDEGIIEWQVRDFARAIERAHGIAVAAPAQGEQQGGGKHE